MEPFLSAKVHLGKFFRTVFRSLIVSALISTFSNESFAQNETIRPQNVNISSPTAASLGKVADIPIGYHTGIPNVSIPIYEIGTGPLKVPISIDYHASGLKVNEQASWVGAGWSLNAGGMITRTVRGMADEKITTDAGPSLSYISKRGFYDYLYDAAYWAPDPYNAIPQGGGLALNDFTNGKRDGEADLFTFNFNGYSGKFYFRADTTVTLAPQQDIVVRPLYCSTGNLNCSTADEFLYGFVVTTPDGVKYYFGKSASPPTAYNSSTNGIPLEYAQTYSYTSGITYAKTPSSWFLNKIVSADTKFSIQFTYAAESYGIYSTSLFPKPTTGSPDYGIDLVKNITTAVRLSKIEFANNGVVTFIPSTGARKDLSSASLNLIDTDQDSTSVNAGRALSEIQISSGSGTPCRSFAFAYGYFYDNTHSLLGYLSSPASSFGIHTDKKRLKLISLTENSCPPNSISKPPHIFRYFDEASVPRTLSFAADHWGYFNNATGNATMLPALSIDNGLTNVGGTYGNRESSWPAMRAGSLEKIQYPTGGSTRFVFSNHEVLTPVVHFDSVAIGTLSAIYTNTVGPLTFTVDANTRYIKTRPSLPYGNGNGSGNIHIINTATHIDYGSSSTSFRAFVVPPGNYEFSVQSGSNTSYPIMCTAYKMVGEVPTDNLIGTKSALYSSTSPTSSFTVTATTVMKAVRTLPYAPRGAGILHLINTSSNVDYFPPADKSQSLFQIPAGTYNYYVESTSGQYYPIQYTLYTVLGAPLETRMVGGLRIDSVIYDDGQGHKAKVQAFSYRKNNEPQGVLYGRPSYMSPFFNHEIRDMGGILNSALTSSGCLSITTPGSGPYLFFVSAASILPMRSIQGNHIGYNYVRVNEVDGGYTIHEFNGGANLSLDVCQRVIDYNVCNPDAGDYPIPPEAFKPDRGNPTQTTIFNSTGMLLSRSLQSTKYTFEAVGVDGVKGASIGASNFPTFYEWKAERKVQSVEETFSYDAINTLVAPTYKKTTTYYSSTRHNQPTRIVVTDAANTILNEVRKIYVGDVIPPACDPAAAMAAIDLQLQSDADQLKSTYDYIQASIPIDKYTFWQKYYYNLNILKKNYITAVSNSRLSILANYKTCMSGSGSWSESSASPEIKTLVKMQKKNLISSPIESTYRRYGKIQSAEYLKYEDYGDGIQLYPSELDVVKVQTPLDTTAFTPASFGNSAVTRDSRYKWEATFSFFNGNMKQVTPRTGVISSYIWNNSGVHPIAAIQNAPMDQCAYTSFEESGTGEGGWLFTFTNSSENKTGAKAHTLYNNSISKGGLTTSKTYTVSFWAKGGTPSVSAGVVSSNDAAAADADGWKYFEKTITGVSAFTLSSVSGVYLDELRLYPKGGLMTTYTYDPLVGITSQSDPNNRIIYYIYDKLARLIATKDHYHKVVQKQDYFYNLNSSAVSLNSVASYSLIAPNVTDESTVGALPVTDVTKTTSYFDGLGRPIQTVTKQGSPLQFDMVLPVAYDALGREKRKYLPFVNGADGQFKSNVIDANGNYTGVAQTFYSASGDKIADDAKPYSEVVYENSPLNRVQKSGAPGAAWQPIDSNPLSTNDNTVKKRYELNGAGEIYLFVYDATSGQVTTASFYAASELVVTRTYDEKNNDVKEYVDKYGHTVCKKVKASATEYASTYYVYDVFDNLVVVLPPEAVKSITGTSN